NRRHVHVHRARRRTLRVRHQGEGVTVATDSLTGWVATTLADPAGMGDSLTGWVSTTLYDPITQGDSGTGYVTATLRNPHHPIALWDGASMRYAAIRTWDGTKLV